MNTVILVPAVMQACVIAHREAVRTVSGSFPYNTMPGERLREEIATLVLDLASSGEERADVLQERVLARLKLATARRAFANLDQSNKRRNSASGTP
ncbi:MAG: hypothetical protein HOP13_10405 [Alphaproteobacteria bacterium]|nr:hypothetical protein [Alphaproteobacteria bacterium]